MEPTALSIMYLKCSTSKLVSISYLSLILSLQPRLKVKWSIMPKKEVLLSCLWEKEKFKCKTLS